MLSKNRYAIKLLEKNIEKIDWRMLSLNSNAIHLLEANQDKICWNHLCKNPNAIHLLEANPDKINLYYLFQNSNVKAIDLIKNKMKVYLTEENNYENNYENNLLIADFLAYNPNVLSIILKWDYYSIKTYFYTSYGKELIEWIYNPKNMNKWGNTCWDLD
jgi:hypothetical protein